MKDKLYTDLIIEEIRKKEQRDNEDNRPFLQLPLDDSFYWENQKVKQEVTPEPKRVVIIDL